MHSSSGREATFDCWRLPARGVARVAVSRQSRASTLRQDGAVRRERHRVEPHENQVLPGGQNPAEKSGEQPDWTSDPGLFARHDSMKGAGAVAQESQNEFPFFVYIVESPSAPDLYHGRSEGVR